MLASMSSKTQHQLDFESYHHHCIALSLSNWVDSGVALRTPVFTLLRPRFSTGTGPYVWKSFSVTCCTSVASSGCSGFHQQWNWLFIIIIPPPRYDPGSCRGITPYQTKPLYYNMYCIRIKNVVLTLPCVVSGAPIVLPLCWSNHWYRHLPWPLPGWRLYLALLQTAVSEGHHSGWPGECGPWALQQSYLDTVS